MMNERGGSGRNRPHHRRQRDVPIVVASRLFPPEPGAAAFRLGSLVRRLGDAGVDVEVLTTIPPIDAEARWSSPHTKVRRWPVLRDRGGNVRGYVPYASFDVPLLLRLMVVRRPRFVLVEPPPTTGFVVLVACWLRRVPFVYYAGDVSSTAAAGIGVAGWAVAVLRALEAFVLRKAALVLAVSEGVASDVRTLAGPRAHVVVVGTGVDTDTFTPTPDGLRAQSLVYAGTMSEIQGAGVFVEAFALIAHEFPDTHLIMYGQGTEARAIERLARRILPGRVLFPGVAPGHVVAAALSRAAAGLASLRPGIGYDYAYPTKMFAATACGTPVLYAGPGPGRGVVKEHLLGWSVDWEAVAVSEAMAQALRTSATKERAEYLVRWTRTNASQHVVTRRALDALRPLLARDGSTMSGHQRVD